MSFSIGARHLGAVGNGQRPVQRIEVNLEDEDAWPVRAAGQVACDYRTMPATPADQ
jgi:hypothetical protein